MLKILLRHICLKPVREKYFIIPSFSISLVHVYYDINSSMIPERVR